MLLDEITMVAPDQLLQANERLKQAKSEYNVSFGHLLCVFTCDFLQLPLVQKGMLATKMDDASFVKASKAFRKHRSEIAIRKTTMMMIRRSWRLLKSVKDCIYGALLKM